mgnify:CR=1 FL=1
MFVNQPGVNIDLVDDETFHLSQPHLIEQILRDLNLDGENAQAKETPSPMSRVLGAHESSPVFHGHFHCRSVLGKLNCLEKRSRPDIAHTTHQCARFSSDPRKEHGKSVCILLALVLRNSWHTVQLDCALALPQAPVDRECHMQIPKGIKINRPGKWALRVHKNICGQKQAGRVWNQHPVDKPVTKVGFEQSGHDECALCRGNVMCALCTDDPLLAGLDKEELQQVIADIKKAGLDATEEGDIEDFLGVNIDQ